MKYFTKVAEDEKSPNVKNPPANEGGSWGNLKDKVVSGAKFYGKNQLDWLSGNQGYVPDILTGGNPTRETLNTAKDNAVDWAADKYKKTTDLTPGNTVVDKIKDTTTVQAIGDAGNAIGNAIKDPLVNAAKVTGNSLYDLGSNVIDKYRNAGNVLYNSWKDNPNRQKPVTPKTEPVDTKGAPSPELEAE